MARALAKMLIDAAEDACRMFKARRPDFEFMPFIMMNVASPDSELIATTCEFPNTLHPTDLARLLHASAAQIEAQALAGSLFQAREVTDDDDDESSNTRH